MKAMANRIVRPMFIVLALVLAMAFYDRLEAEQFDKAAPRLSGIIKKHTGENVVIHLAREHSTITSHSSSSLDGTIKSVHNDYFVVEELHEYSEFTEDWKEISLTEKRDYAIAFSAITFIEITVKGELVIIL